MGEGAPEVKKMVDLGIGDLAETQMAACCGLARALITQKPRIGAAVIYTPGDAPWVDTARFCGRYQICSDGTGTFDVWDPKPPMSIVKGAQGLTEAEVVAWVAALPGLTEH